MMRHILIASIALFVTITWPNSALGNDGSKTVHIVKRGDTLSKIAKRYKVTVRKIQRWNRMRRRTSIRKGQKLTIYTPATRRRVRKIEYTVRGGDTLSRIAKRHKMELKRLRKINRRVLRRKKFIVAGQKLHVEVKGPAVASKSTGRPQYGRLINGEQLPKGYGYLVKNSNKSWGTNQTITHLLTILPQVKRKFGRRTPDVVVGDISRKEGGYFPPHRSHQNGLDVDIGYYHKDRPHPKLFRVATPKSLDVPRTWFLLKAFLDTGDVDYIFVDYKLQEPLYLHAKRNMPRCNQKRKRKRRACKARNKKWLEQKFQYPRSRGNLRGIIRHSRSHHHHFHIRFMPPDRDVSQGGRAKKAVKPLIRIDKRRKVKRRKSR